MYSSRPSLRSAMRAGLLGPDEACDQIMPNGSSTSGASANAACRAINPLNLSAARVAERGRGMEEEKKDERARQLIWDPSPEAAKHFLGRELGQLSRESSKQTWESRQHHDLEKICGHFIQPWAGRRQWTHLHRRVTLVDLVELLVQLGKIAESLLEVPLVVVVHDTKRIPLRSPTRAMLARLASEIFVSCAKKRIRHAPCT